MRRMLIAAALTSLLTTTAGCGAPEEFDTQAAADEQLGEDSSALTATSGISVSARYSLVTVGTPTYGSTNTQTVLNVRVDVTDTTLKQQFPSFDGLEKAFVLVPVKRNGVLAWDTYNLTWKGTTLGGYYGTVKIDVHESGTISNGLDATTLTTHGVAVGLTTNIGTVWAQQPGNNWPVTRQ